MNCITIDDDKLSRKIIEEFISRTDSLNLVYSFANAVDAINKLKNNIIDINIVFLDIEMPEMTGIEFLNNFKEHPQVIIISSKEKYALEAFEYDVTDYLLKPVSYSRFFKAIEKAQKRIDKKIAKSLDNTIEDIGSKEIFIKSNSSLIKVYYNDITYVEALENYILICTKDNKYTVHFTMKAIENKLPSELFKRVHRSYLVNTQNINKIESNIIVLNYNNENKNIPIGKAYKDKLFKDLNLISK